MSKSKSKTKDKTNVKNTVFIDITFWQFIKNAMRSFVTPFRPFNPFSRVWKALRKK